MRKLVVIAVLALLPAAAALAGGPTALRISADQKGALKFDRKVLTARAGKVTITMSNPAGLPHNIAIKGKGLNRKGRIVLRGGTSSVTALLRRGRYRFYCSVPGHEAAGMWGTLVVK
jgi:plastocyanin